MIGHYGCYAEDDSLMYVGSSGKSLQQLEWNHRNYAKFPNGKWTRFRGQLNSVGHKWQFRWVQEPREISRIQGEIEEGMIIRMLNPPLNHDQYPYETSIRMNRKGFTQV